MRRTALATDASEGLRLSAHEDGDALVPEEAEELAATIRDSPDRPTMSSFA